MVKKFMKAAALMVAAILVAGTVLSGCGQDKNGSSNASDSTTAAGTSAADAASSETEKSGPPKALSVSLYDRGNVPAAEGTADDNRWTRWVKENMLNEYNVEIEYVLIPRWESIQKFNLLLASDEAPDLIMEYDGNFRNQLYVNKQIMPLDDVVANSSVEYKALIEKYPAIKKISTRDDGKMYDFVRSLGASANHALIIRTDWLKNVNLPIPQTVEDLYNVAKAFVKNDPDQNGKDDTLAMSFSFVSGYILAKMFNDNGWLIKDGQVVYGWDEMRAHLEFRKKLYDEGLVDKDYATDKNGEKALQDYYNGKIGIYGSNGIAFQYIDTLKKNNPNAEVEVIALPESQFGRFGPVINVPLQPYAVINADCKNPDAAIKYIDFMTKESTYKTLTFGFEGIHCQPDALGALKPIDPEKSKNEVNYTGDLRIATSAAEYKFYPAKYSQDLSDPIRKEYVDKIWQPAHDIYLDPVKSPFGGITDNGFMPAWPQELVPIAKTLTDGGTGKLAEIQTKAVVSGPSYTIDMAMKDAQDAWKSGGGDQLLKFMNDWYQKNKDTAVLADDIFEAILAMKEK